MNEFKPHDYFKADDKGYISRKVFIEHVRKTYDNIRELADHIDLMIEEFEENERDIKSAETIRLANEGDRVNAENVRAEFYEVFDGELDKKANKQQEAWITPTLLNGFTGNVRYRKTQFGNLEIYGTIISPNPMNKTRLDVFILPLGYRPARDIKFEVSENSYYSFRSAKIAYSTYAKMIRINDGQGGTSWEINVSIPTD